LASISLIQQQILAVGFEVLSNGSRFSLIFDFPLQSKLQLFDEEPLESDFHRSHRRWRL